MRSFLILLLLRCTLQIQLQLAATEATVPCDRSLIRGVDPSKIHFNDVTKTLTCVAGENSLMAIEYNSKRYWSLTCDTYGWKANRPKRFNKAYSHNENEEKVAETSIELHIACVEYCATNGIGVRVEKKGENNNTIEITCEQYMHLGKYYYENLYYGPLQIYRASCSLEGDAFWIFELDQSGKKDRLYRGGPSKQMQLDCRLEPERATEVRKRDENAFPITKTEIPPSVPQTNPEEPLNREVEYSLLKCDRSLIEGVDSPEIVFNEDTKTLTCVDGRNTVKAIRQVLFKTKLYESLSCDESKGWKSKTTMPDGTWVVTTIAEATTPLNIACVEYCATTGADIQISKAGGIDGIIEISCAARYKGEEYKEQLFYGQKSIVQARCSFDGPYHWSFLINRNNSEAVYRPDVGKPAKFECRLELPTPITTTKRPVITTTKRKNNDETTTTIPITSTTTSPSTTITSRSEDKASDAAAQSNMKTPLIVVGSSIGGFIVGAIVVVVIFTMLIARKRRPASSGNGTSVNVTEEGRKKMKKRGGSQSMISSDSAIVSSGQ